MEVLKYWLWLSTIPKVGNRTMAKLLGYFGEVESIYKASKSELQSCGILNEKQSECIIYSRNSDKINRSYEEMLQKKIRLITMYDSEYPNSLRTLYTPPVVIFVKGSLPKQEEWVLAVVGARSCSSYGRQMSRMFGRGIAGAGVSVVSGMARGVDSEAHKGALEANGRTYAVLGCGVDICYPPENMDLYMEIAANGGLISEFAPGVSPEACHFPARNRLIAALSKGIVVVEARKKSGALITVNNGLELGKEIFAVPGRAYDSLNEGSNALIQSGAKLVMTPSDVLEEFGVLAREDKKTKISLDNCEKVVYASLCLIPRSVNELAGRTGLDVQTVIRILTSLELRGIIHRVGINQYILNV